MSSSATNILVTGDLIQYVSIYADDRIGPSPHVEAKTHVQIVKSLGGAYRLFKILEQAGIAPVTERSGKTIWVHRRLACPKSMLQTFHEFANYSWKFCAWSKLYYQQQRTRGNDHHAAIRALAYKWIRIMFRCWKDRTPYNDSLYVKSLTKRGSHLAKGLNQPGSDSLMEILSTVCESRA